MIKADGSYNYYLKDHLGSTRFVFDDDNNMVDYSDYYPFDLYMPDRKRVNSGVKEQFTGKERDAETGFDYFGARYYDPSIGRFITPDPLSNYSPHLTPYHYCRNNPLNRYDPDGRADFGSAEKLHEVAMKVLGRQELKPSNGLTWCNRGVQAILNEGNDHSLDGFEMTADLMYTKLSNKDFATSVSFEEGVKYAKKGITIILATPGIEDDPNTENNEGEPGHVAIMAPEEMTETSGKWGGILVPTVYNVGTSNEKRHANYAFKSKPSTFILNSDLKALQSKEAKNLVIESQRFMKFTDFMIWYFENGDHKDIRQ